MRPQGFFRLPAIIGSLPGTLTNGTTADATQVMSDLNWIVNQVNANAAPLANTALLNANNNFTTVQSGIGASAGANFPIASQVQNWSFNTLTSTLGTNLIAARIAALPLSAYAEGQVFTFVPAQTNTGPVGIVIDAAGSSSVFSNGAPLPAGALQIGVTAAIRRAGSRFDLLPKAPLNEKSWVPVSCPADTTEDILATIVIKGNVLGRNGRMRITTWWVMTSSGNNKTTRVRYSGAAGAQYAAQIWGPNTTAVFYTDIANSNATNSQRGNSLGVGTSGLSVPQTTFVTSAVDTTADTTVVITGQKDTAGETLTLDSYMVEIFPG